MTNKQAVPNPLPQPSAFGRITSDTTLSFGQLAETYDLVYIEVNGLLQPIPAEKAQGICEVFETNRVYADTGYRTAKFSAIDLLPEELAGGDMRAPDLSLIAGYQELTLDEPFQYWERGFCTIDPVCGCCGHHECVND